MTAQTEAQRVKFATPDAGTTIEFRKALAMLSDRDIEWQNITSYQQRTLEKMQDAYAARIAELEAANAELLAALKMNAQALSWLAFGECRGFTDNLPTALEATGAASAAIKKHGGAA